MAQNIIGIGRLLGGNKLVRSLPPQCANLNPPRLVLSQPLHVFNRLTDVPLLVRVHHESAIGAWAHLFTLGCDVEGWNGEVTDRSSRAGSQRFIRHGSARQSGPKASYGTTGDGLTGADRPRCRNRLSF